MLFTSQDKNSISNFKKIKVLLAESCYKIYSLHLELYHKEDKWKETENE